MLIGGKWVNGRKSERFPAINPFNGKTWATIAHAEEQDVHDAVDAAQHAFKTSWRDTPGVERAKLLYRLADLLERNADRMALMESTDNGKVIRETRGQMIFSARVYRFFAGYADKLWGSVIPLDQRDVFDYASREPLGVAALITAWNSPMAILANKLPAALAAGNCVVVKPSEHASATTVEFCHLAEQAGFPPGVINLVTGGGSVGKALVAASGINKISFTGSGGVGRDIAATAGRNLVSVTLELGGKSPNIVFADADINKAVVGVLAGIFAASGQTCIAGSRLLVQRPIFEDLIGRLIQRANSIKLGDPTDLSTEMGPAANEPQFSKIRDFISVAQNEGARLVAGGEPITDGDLANGFFIRPTIFTDVRNDMTIAQEEIFGPVLSVIPFDTEEQAAQIANATRFGLAAGIWTNDLSRALRVSRSIDAGTIWINTYRASAAQAPFGGFKQSGFGRERGEHALNEFMSYKNVMIDYSDTERDPFAQKV